MLSRASIVLVPFLLAAFVASAQTLTPGSKARPPAPPANLFLRNVPGVHSSSTFLNGLGQLSVPAGSGNVTGPGPTTAGYAASWADTSGTVLATGYPVGNSGVFTVLETDGSGKIPASVITPAPGSGNVSGPGSSTNGFIPQWSGTGGTALSTGLPVGNSGNSTVLETDGSGHIPSTTIVNVVTGPGSSTNGNVVRWNGTGGQTLGGGTPVGNSGANNIMQADSGGKLDRSVVPMPLNTTDTGHFEYSGTTPSLNANCGSGATIGGNDVVGRITLGTGIAGTFCTVTFATAWANTPVCNVWDETNGQPLFPQPSSTSVLKIVSVTGNLTDSHSVIYSCIGYQ